MDSTKESILFLDESNDEGSFLFLQDSFPDYSFKKVSSMESCLNEIDKNNTKIVLIDEDKKDEEYQYFLGQVKLTENAPNVIMMSNDLPSVVYINSLYSLGLSNYLLKNEKNFKDELITSIRHIIRNQKLEEINRKLTTRLTESNALLNQKNKRLDEFCSTVAHDIRGPLGGLVMRLEYLKDEYKNISKDREKILINNSLLACERLVNQVQAMYEFAKLGKEAANMEYFDVNEVISGIVEDLSIQNKDYIKFTTSKLPSIWGNRQLVRRVFLNLITNALKYNDKDKKEIQIGFDGIEENTVGRFAKIYVKDNGNGISQEDKKDIFKIFTSLNNREHLKNTSKKANDMDFTEKDDGLGVGLSVVERAIELHFGTIDVNSEIHKGSTFNFTLPVEEIRC